VKLLTIALATALTLAAQNRARLETGLNTIQAATLQADLTWLTYATMSSTADSSERELSGGTILS
jgi:hypothetical protein